MQDAMVGAFGALRIKMIKFDLTFPILIMLSLLLLIGCQEFKQKENSDNNSESSGKFVEKKLTLPAKAKGVFLGEEPASVMKVGNQSIQIPPIKHRLEISDNSIMLLQVSNGETVKSTGNFDILSENEVSIEIEGNLVDNKYNQSYTPKLRFYKDSNTWFIEGVAGSEGCTLKKDF